MSRRRDEAEAEALKVVEGVVERVDFKLAAVAGTGIDLADRKAAAEPLARRAIDVWQRVRPPPPSPIAGSASVMLRRANPSNRSSRIGSTLKIVPRIGAIEGFVAQREIGDDVPFDGGFQAAATGTTTDRADGNVRPYGR